MSSQKLALWEHLYDRHNKKCSFFLTRFRIRTIVCLCVSVCVDKIWGAGILGDLIFLIKVFVGVCACECLANAIKCKVEITVLLVLVNTTQ